MLPSGDHDGVEAGWGAVPLLVSCVNPVASGFAVQMSPNVVRVLAKTSLPLYTLGTTAAVGAEGVLVNPPLLVAVTVNVYAVPFFRPVRSADV